MAFSIQNEPLVIPEQLVLLLRLVYLLLIRKLLLLSPLFANPPLKLLKEFLDFLGSNFWLIDHQGSLLAKSSETWHNFLMFCILAFVIVKTESSPVLCLLSLADGHVEVCSRLPRPRYHIIDINLN